MGSCLSENQPDRKSDENFKMELDIESFERKKNLSKLLTKTLHLVETITEENKFKNLESEIEYINLSTGQSEELQNTQTRKMIVHELKTSQQKECTIKNIPALLNQSLTRSIKLTNKNVVQEVRSRKF